MRKVDVVRQRLACVLGGVAAVAFGGAILMLGPALGAGVGKEDNTLVVAHQRACTELKGSVDLHEVQSCIDYLLDLQSGPVEVFISRRRGGSATESRQNALMIAPAPMKCKAV